MKKLYASYHKLEFRPPLEFKTTKESLELVAESLGYSYNQFEDKSQSKSYQFRSTVTFHRLINLEFLDSRKHGKTLNRVEIHGEALDTLPLDVGKILTSMEALGFICTEAHSRMLLPHDIVSWTTINEYCLADAYTASCKMVSPITDPQNNYAKTWQFGKRPPRRSAHTEGRRLVFYDASKIHPEVTENTAEMELQLYGDTAHKFIYSDRGRDVDLTIRTLGIIRSFMEFKALTGDSNRSRRPAAEFWTKIIGDAAAIHLPKLGKPEAKLGNRLLKFHQELFKKQQQLSKSIFLESLVSYLREHGSADFVLGELSSVF